MAINKVVYGEDTLIDLTDTTATASDVLSGKIFYGKDGEQTTGTIGSGNVASSVFISNQTANSITIGGYATVTGGMVNTTTVYGGSQTVSASNVTSGTLTVTENGTSNCTNYKNVTVNIPFITYYTGSTTPSSSLGDDGDIYLKTT